MNWRLFCSFLLFALLTTGAISSDEIWEGNATQIRRGEFESEGYYAASNSFPNGTVIEVENIRNGKSIEVTVLKRIGNNPNLFLLLSNQAAQRLGINKGDVERVRVMIVPDFGSDVQAGAEELTSSQDPDINPNVGLPEAPSEEEAVEAVEEVVEVAEEQTPRVEDSAVEAAAVEAAVAAEAGVEKEQSSEEVLIAEKAGRHPQKELYTEPREGESSIALDVEPPPVEMIEKEVEEPAVEEGTSTDVAETTLEPPRPDRESLIALEPSDPLPPEQVESVPEVTGAPEETLDPHRAEGSVGVAFVQKDPQLPRETTPETEVEPPEIAVSDEVAFGPIDPVLPDEVDSAKPSGSLDPPQPESTYLFAFSPDDPEAPAEEMVETEDKPEATVEPPEIEVGESVTLSPEEPQPPEKAEADRPEITDTAETPVGVREEEVELVSVVEPRVEEDAVEAAVEPEVAPRVEEEVAVAREREEPDVSAQPALIGDLAKGRTFFVQLGAYSDEALARSLEATYSKNYPIEVAMTGSGTRGIFRVLVGPLSKDESGTVLYWFRARGFRDAFVRSAH